MTEDEAVTKAYNAVTGQDDDEWNPDKTLEALRTLWREALGVTGTDRDADSFVIREFMGEHDGYRIEGRKSHPGFRYVWIEGGEIDDPGEWRVTEQGAIGAAWDDWDKNGQGYHWAPWSKRLAKAAGYDEKRKI